MANRKHIKKDINFLSSQIINECYAFLDYSEVIHYEDVVEIMYEADKLRHDLLIKVNAYNKEGNSHSPKKYFAEIVGELYDKNIELIDRLNSLDKPAN